MRQWGNEALAHFEGLPVHLVMAPSHLARREQLRAPQRGVAKPVSHRCIAGHAFAARVRCRPPARDRKTARSSPAYSRSGGMSAQAIGTPCSMASSTGNPAPSNRLGNTTNCASAIQREQLVGGDETREPNLILEPQLAPPPLNRRPDVRLFAGADDMHPIGPCRAASRPRRAGARDSCARSSSPDRARTRPAAASARRT